MHNEQQKLLQRITLIPDLLGGKPTIRGLRFLVSDVLGLLSAGMSEKEILKQHPILEKEDIQACLLYASIAKNEHVFIIPDHMKEGIRQGMEDIRNGNYIAWEEFEKRYEKWLKD